MPGRVGFCVVTSIVYRPQPGPQEAFLASDADVAIYGGAAGSGKSYSVLLHLAGLSSLKGFAGVVFRRTSTELTGGGSIWEESQEMFRAAGGTARQNPNLDWRFPSGAIVEFRHLQHAWDVHAHQSKQYAAIVFEELTQFEESQFWYMLSRTRTKAKVRAHIRATCNPDADSFVRQLIDWWIGPDGLPIEARSGVKRWFVRDKDRLFWYDGRAEAEAAHPGSEPLSLTFVSAKLDDNPAGDPLYRSRLEALPMVERERLLGRNWNIRHQAGSVLRREWFRVVDAIPSPPMRWVRGWDKGGSTDGDWSRGVKVGDMGGVGLVIADVASVRDTPAGVFRSMRITAEGDGDRCGIAIWQDPGQAGVVDVETTTRELQGYHVDVHRAASSKVEYAQQWAVLAERGTRGETPPIYILRAPWTDALLAELDAFPSGRYDDQVDAISAAYQSIKSGGRVEAWKPKPEQYARKASLF